MGWLGGVAKEIWGLFVDDIGLAVASVVWVLIVWIAARWLGAAAGPALFAGLAGILVTSALRRAGQP